MPHLARWLGLSLALSLACDTGYTIDITVTVPDDVAAAYTPKNRGILMVTLNTDDGSSRRAVTVLCGDAASFEVDLGGEGERKEGIVRAWIEPGTDAPCGVVTDLGVGSDASRDGDEPTAGATVDAASGCEPDNTSVELILAAS